MGIKDQGIEHSKHRYRVSPRTLIFITHEDKVLLLKGSPDKRIWPGKYNGIGGHVERGESVRSAALREIAEETGMTDETGTAAVIDLTLRGVINIVTEEPALGIILFVFTAISESTELSGSVEGTPEWVDWQQLDPSGMVEDLPLLLPRVLSMPPTAPFFACYWYDENDQLQIDFGDSTG
ncbi:MAG: NUDIX domain-containing protein [Anaerolineae bacterium]|nr:NUDIX domain-containing protein [Anaerolineae bacterium]